MLAAMLTVVVVLHLFVQKPLGLLSLLDEESNFPNATDLTFANKLKQHLGGNPCFKAERGRAFVVRHYAGEVSYCSCLMSFANFAPLTEICKAVWKPRFQYTFCSLLSLLMKSEHIKEHAIFI